MVAVELSDEGSLLVGGVFFSLGVSKVSSEELLDRVGEHRAPTSSDAMDNQIINQH